MTLRARLAVGLFTIVLVLVLPLLMAVRSLEQSHRDAQALRDREFAASLLLGNLRESLNDIRLRETALLFIHEPKSFDAMVSEVNHMEQLADSLDGYGLEAPARDIRGAVQEIAVWLAPEYDAAVAGHTAESDSISAKHSIPAITRADRSVLVAERDLRARTKTRVEDTTAALYRAEVVAISALVLAIAIAAVVALWLVVAISGPVQRLESGMQAIADGNLGWRLPDLTSRQDEFGKLARSFETMTEQLQELDKLKAEFVSVASHELKTPINVVLGYVQLLAEGLFGPVAPKQQEVLRTVETQMHGLARLVKQLLDVSRFEAGGGKLEPRSFGLNEFLSDLDQAFAILAVQRGIRFSVTRDEGLPTHVTWDHDRMSEVLGNLLSNAFKFTERGGEVQLSVEPVKDGVRMEVRDTGAGIPQEQVPHIFDKFFQASNQPARSMGSGLGLAIAKEIVEAHRGHIQCESTPGVGTTFMITLPQAVAGRRPSMQRAEPAGV